MGIDWVTEPVSVSLGERYLGQRIVLTMSHS